MIRTAAQAERFLLRAVDYERGSEWKHGPEGFHLGPLRAYLEAQGRPQDSWDSIHVAGTKGKGTTAAAAAALLAHAGVRTGLYTSPHLCTMRERLRVDGRPIEAGAFARLVSRLAPGLSRPWDGRELTFFEALTAAAFVHFRSLRVATAVLETGLGGRLDATNVVRPRVSVVTRIGIDHTAQLGRTLALIAAEKAGIVKPGVPVVAAANGPSRAVLDAAARRAGSTLWRLGRELRLRVRALDERGTRFDLRLPGADYPGVWVPLPGRHHAENCALALAAVCLSGLIRPTSGEAREALAHLDWPGRGQLLATTPPFIVDGAHNAPAMRALEIALGEAHRAGPVLLVFGAGRDKDARSMLRTLAPRVRRAWFCSSGHPRARAPEDLLGLWPGPAPAEAAGYTAEALGRAARAARRGERVLVTGSFYVAGQALDWLRRSGLLRTVAGP
ncbi:MAG: bifunctional folylpolyglutamate synthase/dihydrofolate synthase [Planctomycetes bacterium]|nr:bifunctional folylpolyglutamate synthase/dihydrofolate synthase [Planctomycetota bacterium]